MFIRYRTCMTDRKQVEQLFRMNYRPMYRLACLLLHDADEAHDAVADIFARLLEQGGESRLTSSYLLVAVRHRCIDRMRQRTLHEQVGRLYALDEAMNAQAAPDEERHQRLRRAISEALPTQARRVLLMRYYEGMTYQEIASALGISEVAVYKHLKNAIMKLKTELSNTE